MFKFIIKFFAIFFLLTLSSEALNFNNVLIKGNVRISNETILVFSEIPDDKSLDENSINIILKKLYDSGFFKDVAIKIDNNNLIISVVENPIIQTVFIEGIKRKKTEDSIYDVLSLKDRSSFNNTLLKQDEVKISSYLKQQGFYFSKIATSFQDLGDNKIDLFYKIDLGNKAKISKISFIGDKKISNNKLRSIIVSDEYKFWKILSGKKYLNENTVELDKRLLTNFYKNKGFYSVNINSSFANYLGNDKFELSFNISAGEKYYFNDLSFDLPVDYDDVNFSKLKLMFNNLKGEPYSLNSIDKILNEINKIALNEKYEFLKSSVNEEIIDNLINLTFNIQESEKLYIEKINIYGNNVTEDGVIRNNFLVDEGDAFNELLYTRTINNIRGLNYFRNVSAQVLEGSSDKQKIININIEEKPTGEIVAGAGLGTNGGTVAFGVKENNFLGKGIEFGADLALSTEKTTGLLSFNNPNYKGKNRSLNFSIESSVTDRLTNYGYKSNKTGFSIGSGFEYYDDLFLRTGISSYVEKLDTDSTASANLKKQDGSYFDTFLNYTLDYDKRDQKFQPSDGYRSRFTQNIPLISENYALKNTYDYKIYDQWLNENIASFAFLASATNSINNKNVKLSDRLFASSKRLRGFESGKIGPKDGIDFIGGNYSVAINASTTVPQLFPNYENANFLVFFDAANVWGVDYSNDISGNGKIRSTLGIAIDFFTPIGPLNFSLSQPITKASTDITETFRFNLGTTF
tara:strand:+ start:525 stop:2762 length:2238 start_codon:yes stop_codon:yes gene_type:complete